MSRHWLVEVFHPDGLEHSLAMMEAAQPDQSTALTAGRESLAVLDRKLQRYRSALDAGTLVVSQWIGEVQAERNLVEARIRELDPKHEGGHSMTRDEISRLDEAMGGMAKNSAEGRTRRKTRDLP
ncbi:hypothetical protein [Nocardia cyriacigeorgica]|uniref:hypothetical protein n=1 Tax=Nocardia cyriacigeorgica TaxID=135487 RepID=UPI0013CF692E|nr:hypothetical protein [Nocardia cyriacigeorgica]NEW27065.1 hypothetical protein [Nocardia cyriacigeorgica]